MHKRNLAFRKRLQTAFVAAAMVTGVGGFYVAHNSGDLLIRAAERGDLISTRALVLAGTNIHRDNDAALRWAATNGHVDAVEVLLDYGANIHANGDSALRWAAFNGHTKIVQLLLSRGAGSADFDYDQLARLVAFNGHDETLKLILNHVNALGTNAKVPKFSPLIKSQRLADNRIA